ncbi:hypothetical protein NHP190003_15330 [Helicobacter sp. NHP19-003]|uniref:Autotransporter domain-containing protein n=1 Tax=Helicobacter gastrocanis TaxID=2849641 RepID=A0ABM7SC44_9HELI|nr:vacuolating cytotoxin domain-containing protein [Helicobacter sp. NHP19-003]BCZ18251.1 hypothetical protein NHP190003_15330 [Helicobacter sp. NHP19-003]
MVYISLDGKTIKESFGSNALTFSLYVPPPPKPKPQDKPQNPSANTPNAGQSGPNIAGTGGDSGPSGTTNPNGSGAQGQDKGTHTAGAQGSGSSSGTDNSGDNTHTASGTQGQDQHNTAGNQGTGTTTSGQPANPTASSGTGQATGNTGGTAQGSHTASSGTSSAGSGNSGGNTHTTQGSGDSGNNTHTAGSTQGTHTADSGTPGQDQHNAAGNSGQGGHSGNAHSASDGSGSGSGTTAGDQGKGAPAGTQGAPTAGSGDRGSGPGGQGQGQGKNPQGDHNTAQGGGQGGSGGQQGGTHIAQGSPGVTPPQPIPQNVNSMDIWKDVYDMDNSQTWSPNVGTNGIAYIDPSHNHSDPGYNQPGLPQNSLTANATYQAWPPHNYTGSSTAVQGNNATLVIGNDQIKAVGLNDPRSVVWLDPSESGTEHSETSLQADNVFMTNNFFIGRTSSTDGTGNIGITANKTFTMDGLQFTAYSGTGSAISNYSWDKFKSLGSLNIQNSQFANGGGALYFSTPTASVNNAQFSGNGTTIGFDAFNQTNPSVVNNNPNTNNITPGQMSFANTTFSEKAGGHILINGSSVDLGTSIQGTKYTGTSPASGAVRFSGNNTDIAIASTTGNISATSTSFKEQAGGNISLKSGQNLTIGASSANPTNDSSYTSAFIGNNTNINLQASGALSVANTLFNDPLQNANSPQNMTLAGASITLNNNKFEGYSQYHFNTNSLTLQGTTTIATNNYLNKSNVATSPFSTYAGNVSFGSKALLDLSNTQEILNALQDDNTYTLLSGKNIDYASDTAYAKNLWQMVQFGGQSATLATQGLPQGATQGQNGIYYVSLDGQTIEETFGAKSLTLSLLNQEKDVWGDVYTMTPGCSPAAGGGCIGWPHWYDIVHGGYKTYSPNVGTNGIAYIDPTHQEAEGWSNGNTLSTYTGTGNGMHLQVQGTNNTLVIGNDTKQAATGGIVRLGGINGIYKIDVGYITDTFNAANIFMTNTFQTGNAAKTGGGANVSFTATNNITLDGLNYQNLKAGTQHSNASFVSSGDITATNSNFVDNSGGVFNFHGQNDTFTNSTFSGDSSQINIDASNSLSLTNTNLNNGMSTINLNATNTLTMGPSADSAPSTAEVPTSAINAKALNVSAQTATFNNTSFTLDPTSNTTSQFKVNHLTFNNDTFEGIGSTYSFSGTQNTTFLGTNTIATTDLSNNPNSPFKSLGGNVTLGSNARFDVSSPLTYNKTYTLVSGSHINWRDDSYAKELWGLVQYQGMSAISAQSTGNDSYIVEFGGLSTPIKVKETFNNNEIQLTLISQIQDIWPDVHQMTTTGWRADPAHWCTPYTNSKCNYTYTYNTNNNPDYVAYIDPNLKNGAYPYSNPGGKLLSTYSATANGANYDVEGQGTLIIGNNTNAAATGGTIWFGIQNTAQWDDHCVIGCGTITDTFNAYNVYLTNTIKIGQFALGGGASMTYTARNNLTADGLNYDQIATVFPGMQTNASQHSSAYFIANKNMSILNSNFNDASWGLFSFSAHNGNLNFTGSQVQGSETAVTLDSPNVALTNTNFYLGQGSNLNIENSNQGGGGTLSATGSTFSLNEKSHATFGTNANFNNSTVLLNNGASASFGSGGTFAGNSALDADNSTLSVSGNASFSNGAVLSLINHAVANLQAATFADNANVNVDQGSQANFSGAVTFNDTSSLNVNGTGASATLGAATFNAGTHMILNGGASATIKGAATFNGGNVNLNNSALSVGGNATLNSANFALQGTSSFDISGGASSSGTTNLSLYGTDPLSVGQNFGVSGVLNFKGASNPSSVPLVKVGGTFDLSKTGILDLSNVDLSTALGASPKVYNIVDARSIQGISGADGYQKIDFYGMQIQNATYNATNNSWSFANPLNGAELITERIENGDLSVTISSNPNPIATNLFNIAPELFYYKQSKQNITGTDYDYSDDRVGTFFLDSNFKGVFIPPATSKINPIQPEIPGTYDGYNQPLDPLNIYNAGISQADFGPLMGIASTLWPALEKLLASGVLNNLSDPAKVMQALGSVQINLTPAQKQELLNVIAGFDSKINQTFQNGNLVVGGTELGQVNSTSKVWFGGNGYAGTCTSGPSCQELRNTYLGQLFGSTGVDLGYIEANFNAKNIYITGTVGSGNSWHIGGSAEVSFNSATNLVLNQANIEAQGTDQIFPLLGAQGLDKILSQPGLGGVLGNLIYQKSLGESLVPQGLSLPGSIANETLGQIFSAQDLGEVFTIPGMANILKDILSSKTVGSLLGSGGLISSLSQSEQDKIYGMLSNEIEKGLDTLSPAAKAAAQAGLGVAGGVQGVQHLINTFYSKDTLLTLIDQIAPMTGMTLNQALSQANSPQATAAMQKFLNDTTFGQVFSQIIQNSGLINKTVSWLGPQILTDIMDMAIADALNPLKALQNMAEDVGIKILDQVLGANTMDTLKNLTNQKAISNILDSIIDNKGLGALWANGLGSVLPPNIQKVLQKAGVGALLAPKGLSALWEKGYFSFAAHENVLSNNSNYSNETGGTLSFIAGNQIVFSGKNNISFSNYQGTLNFFSNKQSNIDLTSLNATDGLNLNAQFENLNIAGGTIALNQYESLAVSAQNFNFLGTINDTGGLIDLTGITGANVIGTMNLQGASTLKTNNLSIAKALDNQSTNAINVGGDLTLYSGATLTTQAQGINVGGALNSQGSYVFNLNPNSGNTATSNTGTQGASGGASGAESGTSTGTNSSGGNTGVQSASSAGASGGMSQNAGNSQSQSASTGTDIGSANSQSANSSANSTSSVAVQNTGFSALSVGGTNNQSASGADSQSTDNTSGADNGQNQSANSSSGASSASNTPITPNTPLVQVQGIATLDASSNTMITFQGDAANTYTLLDSQKWMRYGLYQQNFDPNSWKDYLTLYTYLNINGKSMQLNKQGNGLTYNGQAVKIADRGLLVSYQNAQGQTIQASIAFDNIKLGVNKNLNVGMPNIEQYIAHIQGEGSVRAVYAAGGPGVMGWLNQLLIDTKNTPLFAAYYLEDNSQANLVKIAKDIANSIDLVASPTLKATTSRLLQINTFTQQMSRLAKLSSFASNDTLPDFHDFLVSLKGKKFASAVPNDMDIITAYSQRNKLKNNLWITGVGGASFVAGGTGTLYGVNMGYDRFIKGVIVGGYAAYGYSGFYGNITNSASNNVNVGVYSRAFLKGRHEITGSANETWGYNNAYINATDPILSIVNQRYNYSTWTTNLRANYGYDFFFKNKRVILKPQIGLAYYYIGLSGLQGTMNNPFYNQFKANADPANKSVLTLNLALESRHYFNKNSYYFVLASIGRDLFVHSMGDKVVRFIGDDMLSYRNGGMYNTFAGLTTGGEIRLFRSFYINASIGARFGLDYQDINITGNVGMRYAF